MSREIHKKLEDLALEINGLEKNSLKDRIKRIAYLIPITWFAGSLSGEFQKEYLEKIRISREYAKYLTIGNASIFGIGYSSLVFFGGNEASHLVRNLADFLGIAFDTANKSYFLFNILQNTGRIGYSLATDKPAISFSLMGIGGTGIKKTLKYFKRK